MPELFIPYISGNQYVYWILSRLDARTGLGSPVADGDHGVAKVSNQSDLS
jgi:hypothetical protein